MNEVDTCRTLVTPKLRSAGWTDEQIREQVTFTHGRIVPSGGQVARKVQKRADCLLYYQSKYKVAVIEAKEYAKMPECYKNAKDLVPCSPLDEQRCIVACLNGLQAKVNALRELQPASGEELRPFVGRTLMPSILDKAFKGEL